MTRPTSSARCAERDATYSPSPPTVTTRLFGFDGEKFRTVWTTDHFFSPYIDRAVQLTPDGGFTLRTMPDPKGNVVMNERYAVTADGQRFVIHSTEERRRNQDLITIVVNWTTMLRNPDARIAGSGG